MSTTRPPELLFVYGTLRRAGGHPAHAMVGGQASYLCTTRAPGALYDLGPYPGMAPAPAGETTVGEVYRLPAVGAADLLARLDEYEGVRSTEVDRCVYERRAIELPVEGRPRRAWTYVLRAVPPGARPIASGDWLDRDAGAVARDSGGEYRTP
ncbi:MAG: gamma-glutamylcyclotransferase family protein [Gemmatimonadales bacterium]